MNHDAARTKLIAAILAAGAVLFTGLGVPHSHGPPGPPGSAATMNGIAEWSAPADSALESAESRTQWVGVRPSG